MLIHAGFHGQLKNDLLAYVPGQCQLFKNRISCLKSKVGVKCVWDTKRDKCFVHPAQGRVKSGVETCLNDNHYRNSTLSCSKLKSCSSCVSTSLDCVWCSNPDRHDTSTSHSGHGAKEKSYCAWQSCKVKSTKSYQRAEECVESGLVATPGDWCPDLISCHICQSKEGCTWRGDKPVSKCSATEKKNLKQGSSSGSGGGGGGNLGSGGAAGGGSASGAGDGGANLTDEPGRNFSYFTKLQNVD